MPPYHTDVEVDIALGNGNCAISNSAAGSGARAVWSEDPQWLGQAFWASWRGREFESKQKMIEFLVAHVSCVREDNLEQSYDARVRAGGRARAVRLSFPACGAAGEWRVCIGVRPP